MSRKKSPIHKLIWLQCIDFAIDLFHLMINIFHYAPCRKTNYDERATIASGNERNRRATPILDTKARILGNYILKNPRKAVFMTTKELAETCRVSEATVVRFVSRLGYKGYGAFQQALRDFVDTELTLLDRTDLSDMQGPGTDRLRRVVFEEMDNLKHFFETVDLNILNRVVDFLEKSNSIYVIGSRLSYTFAYYLGWSLTKIRPDVRIIKGERQHIDRLVDHCST